MEPLENLLKSQIDIYKGDFIALFVALDIDITDNHQNNLMAAGDEIRRLQKISKKYYEIVTQ